MRRKICVNLRLTLKRRWLDRQSPVSEILAPEEWLSRRRHLDIPPCSALWRCFSSLTLSLVQRGGLLCVFFRIPHLLTLALSPTLLNTFLINQSFSHVLKLPDYWFCFKSEALLVVPSKYDDIFLGQKHRLWSTLKRGCPLWDLWEFFAAIAGSAAQFSYWRAALR